jgi:hypothetical protein
MKEDISDTREIRSLYDNFDKMQLPSKKQHNISHKIKIEMHNLMVTNSKFVKIELNIHDCLQVSYIDNHYITPFDLYSFWNSHISKYRNYYYNSKCHLITSDINNNLLKLNNEWHNYLLKHAR